MATKTNADLRYERFAREFVVDHNGKQAAIRAGYSERSAESQASRLLRYAKVRQIIKKLEAKTNKGLDLQVDRIKLEVARVAYFNVKNAFDERGNPIPIHQMPDDVAAGIAVLKFDPKGRIREIRGWDKNSGLVSAMKHTGMFGKDNDQVGKSIARVIVIPAKKPAGQGAG